MAAKVFMAVPGAEVSIGLHGLATTTVGVSVPDDVAEQLEWEMAGCPCDEEGNRDMGGKPTRAEHKHYRIERDAPPPRLAPGKKTKPVEAPDGDKE